MLGFSPLSTLPISTIVTFTEIYCVIEGACTVAAEPSFFVSGNSLVDVDCEVLADLSRFIVEHTSIYEFTVYINQVVSDIIYINRVAPCSVYINQSFTGSFTI